MATFSGLHHGSHGGPLPYLPRPSSLGLPAFAGLHQTAQDALCCIRALQRQGSLGVGQGFSLWGSGALWLASTALGTAREG